MEESLIYDLLSNKLLDLWRRQAEKKDNCFAQSEKEILKKLSEGLTESNKELLQDYALAVENRLEYIFYNLKIKILNFGINIGLQLQKAFSEFDDLNFIEYE